MQIFGEILRVTLQNKLWITFKAPYCHFGINDATSISSHLKCQVLHKTQLASNLSWNKREKCLRQVTVQASAPTKVCNFIREYVTYGNKKLWMANEPKVSIKKKENRSFLLLLFRHWIAKNFLLCVNLPPVSVMTLWLSSSPFRYRAVAWLSLSRSLKLIIQMWGKSIRRDKSQITRIGAFCEASTTVYDKNSVFQFSLCKFFHRFRCVYVSKRYDVGRNAYWFMGNNHHRRGPNKLSKHIGGLPKMSLKKVVAQTDQKKVDS